MNPIAWMAIILSIATRLRLNSDKANESHSLNTLNQTLG
jgi:hypothetical protein